VRPVIALLTDFGTRDHYAGVMKGVVLGISPDAALVDISHDVPRHDVMAAALELAAACHYFPPGTIFLVVVDPGVGSARRAIAVEAGHYRFVAPDNGVLTRVLEDTPVVSAVELTEPQYARPTISRTFEGRDRFAPAAAWLANGVELSSLGRPAGALQRLRLAVPVSTPDGLLGEIVRVDVFGNLISNIDRRTCEAFAAGSVPAVHLDDRLAARLVSTYAEGKAGELTALFGSSDHLEVAVNGGSAAERAGAGRGARVRVSRGA
jgi:S-adenosylmethionine hydrolase